MEKIICPVCNAEIQANFNFCPNCGKKFHEPDLKVPIGRQILVYFISIFFPPFGLGPGIKYFKSKNPSTQMVGIIAIVLTILSTAVAVWIGISLFQSLSKLFTSYTSTQNSINSLQNNSQINQQELMNQVKQLQNLNSQ